MRRFALPAAGLLVVLAGGSGACFPELPDSTLVDNLRVLAIQADPATANFADFPAPIITVRALTVDPGDEDLSEATHTWSLELPDDIDSEDLEQLERLIPDEPHGTSLELDLMSSFEERGGIPSFELVQSILPLRYRVETPDDHREAVKLVSFLFPVFEEGDDDDSAPGDDDDSAPGDDDDDDGPPGPEELEELINENPRIVSIQVGDGDPITDEAGGLPGVDVPLHVGSIDEAGVELVILVEDDGSLEELEVGLYRTTGCPSLAPEESEDSRFGSGGSGGFGQGDDEDPCGGSDDSGGFGFGSDDDDVDWSRREFAWRPLPGESSEGARLFVVLRDEEGGQAWQELRPEPAP